MKRFLLALGILFIVVSLTVYMHGYMSALKQSDWSVTYYSAAHAVMKGYSPYGAGFFNPPWALIPLIPIALFPADWGNAIMFVLNLLAFILVIIRLKISILLFLPLVFISGVMYNSIIGNIDGFCALGFILPPPLGLFFVMAKPQVGIGVAFFWAFNAWSTGGWKLVLKTFTPVCLAFILSFVIFGNWMNGSTATLHAQWNRSVFPFGVPFGLVLIGLAVWRKQIGYAIAAGPMLAPYLNSFSWSFFWIGLAAALPFGKLFNSVRSLVSRHTL